MKTLKRFATLLFAAAMIFAAASCSKEEGIEESQIVGKWQFPTDVEYSDFKGNTLEINGDHTAIMHISRFEVVLPGRWRGPISWPPANKAGCGPTSISR